METQPTNNTKNSQLPKENINWLLLMIGLLLGIAFGLVTGLGLYELLAFEIIGGAIGGIAAGLIQGFSWRFSRIIRTILNIILIVGIVSFLIIISKDSELFGVLLFMMIPGIVSFLVVFFVTKAISAQQSKSPMNWLLFGLLLVISVIISIVTLGFIAFLTMPLAI